MSEETRGVTARWSGLAQPGGYPESMVEAALGQGMAATQSASIT